MQGKMDNTPLLSLCLSVVIGEFYAYLQANLVIQVILFELPSPHDRINPRKQTTHFNPSQLT